MVSFTLGHKHGSAFQICFLRIAALRRSFQVLTFVSLKVTPILGNKPQILFFVQISRVHSLGEVFMYITQ